MKVHEDQVYACMQWLLKDFLGYITGWEISVESQEGYTKEQRNKMMLSHETRQGLKMAGICMY